MYKIDGFLFEDEAIVEIAKKEETAVNYLKEHTALNEVENVYQLYTRLLEQKLFVTPIGIRFLTELQSILYHSEVPNETIPPIPVVWYQNSEIAQKSQTMGTEEQQKEVSSEEGKEAVSDEKPSEIQKEDTSVADKKNTKNKSAKKETSTTKEVNKYKKAYHVALFFAIVFGLSVVGMFIISELSENNVNIINYRNELINEYSTWEAELKEKEETLKTWEAELEQKEETLGTMAE